MTRRRQQIGYQVAAWLGLIVAVGAVAGGIIWGSWRLMQRVPADGARAWALVASALVPVSVYVTWRLAHLEATGLISGISLGVDKVTRAGQAAASLGLGTRASARRQDRPPAPMLPPVEIVDVTPRDGGEIIEL